ncbi:MAG: hypothetical protein WKF96_00170 [Solirubrobacteraceae bacterium]
MTPPAPQPTAKKRDAAEQAAAQAAALASNGQAPTGRTSTVALSDISDEDRALLLEQVRAEQQGSMLAALAEAGPDITGPGAAELRAQLRDRATAALMHSRDHLRNCPIGDPENPATGEQAPLRVESYAAISNLDPAGKPTPEHPVTIVRCITCGGSNVIHEPYATVRDALDASLVATTTDA